MRAKSRIAATLHCCADAGARWWTHRSSIGQQLKAAQFEVNENHPSGLLQLWRQATDCRLAGKHLSIARVGIEPPAR